MMARVTLGPAARVAVGGFVVNVAILVVLLVARGDVAWFAHFGADEPVAPHVRRALGADVTFQGHRGHDGQVFWALARDPLLVDPDTVAADLDRPAYRGQRILYPALAAPWRLAGEGALLWGLVATNLAAVLVGGYLTTTLARDVGAPSRAGLAFALNPLVLLSVAMDFADALALAALVGALVAVRSRRWALAAIAAACAGLAKDSSLIGIVAVALLVPALPRVRRVLLVAAPLVAVTAWGLYVRWRFDWPHTEVNEFALPFVGFVDMLRDFYPGRSGVADVAVAFALVPTAVWIAVRWWRRRTFVLTAALPFAAMVPFLGAPVLYLPINSLRAIGPAITLLVIDLYTGARAPDVSPRRGVLDAAR
jgi:hypothetical protein